MSFSLLLWSPAGSLAAGFAAGVAVRDFTFTLGIDLFAVSLEESFNKLIVKKVLIN